MDHKGHSDGLDDAHLIRIQIQKRGNHSTIQTLYIALILLDNFFEATYNLPKADFQLAGAAALFISAKLQEFQPLSSKQFAKSTKDRYSAEDIKAMEMKICKVTML